MIGGAPHGRSLPRPQRSTRAPALAGIVGPAAFIAAWVSAGLLTAGYSPVDDAISRLAAVGAPTRVLMTAGFVCFGVAVPAYALELRRHLGGAAWMGAAVSGAATLGVALFPLGASAAIDGVHNAMAASGYLALVAVPLLGAGRLGQAGHPRAAVASLVAAVVAGGCLAATLLVPAHGLYQRAGLTVVDVWLMASAFAIIGWPRRVAPSAPQAHRSARS